MAATATPPETKAPPTFYARIPPQDFDTMPPRKVGKMRILGQTFEAGGKWKGPWSEKRAIILRGHKKKGCAPTFQVLSAEKVKKLVASPGGPMSPGETRKVLAQLQATLTRLQQTVDAQDAQERGEAEEEVLAEATAELGPAGGETIPGTDPVDDDDAGTGDAGGATLDLDDMDDHPPESPAETVKSGNADDEGEPEIHELDLGGAEASSETAPASGEGDQRSGTADIPDDAGEGRKFATPAQHQKSGRKTSPPQRAKKSKGKR